jgi:hypothetical protein
MVSGDSVESDLPSGQCGKSCDDVDVACVVTQKFEIVRQLKIIEYSQWRKFTQKVKFGSHYFIRFC